MEKSNNLMDVMNAVSRQIDVMAALPASSSKQHSLTDFDGFLLSDDLLASLQKQYLDAKAIRKKSQKEFDANDGMVEMAAINEDSAWCAMQTRYMELRDDDVSSKKAKMALEKETSLQGHRREVEEEKEALDYYRSIERIKQTKDSEKVNFAMLIWALLVLSSIRADFFRIQNMYKFNQLAA